MMMKIMTSHQHRMQVRRQKLILNQLSLNLRNIGSIQIGTQITGIYSGLILECLLSFCQVFRIRKKLITFWVCIIFAGKVHLVCISKDFRKNFLITLTSSLKHGCILQNFMISKNTPNKKKLNVKRKLNQALCPKLKVKQTQQSFSFANLNAVVKVVAYLFTKK